MAGAVGIVNANARPMMVPVGFVIGGSPFSSGCRIALPYAEAASTAPSVTGGRSGGDLDWKNDRAPPTLRAHYSGVAGPGGIFGAHGGLPAQEVEVAALVGLQHVVEEEGGLAPRVMGPARASTGRHDSAAF